MKRLPQKMKNKRHQVLVYFTFLLAAALGIPFISYKINLNITKRSKCLPVLDPGSYEILHSKINFQTYHGYKRIQKCGQFFYESIRKQGSANHTPAAEDYARKIHKSLGTGFIDFQFPDSAFYSVDFGLTTFPSEVTCSSKYRKTPSIYLSTMITVDGFRIILLESFLDYYSSIGIKSENILVTVQLTPFSRLERVVKVMNILTRKGVYHDTFIGNWSSEALMYHQAHKLLHCTILEDWIIVADSDEFHEYPTNNVTVFLKSLDTQGINVVNGMFLDRISLRGSLIDPSPKFHIFSQFELGCELHRVIGLGTPKKVMAFKGYLRINRGHHRLALCWFWNRRNYLDLTTWKVCPPRDLVYIKTYKRRLNVHHFKWMKGQYESTKQKAEVWKGTPVAKSYINALKYFDRCSDICVHSSRIKCRKQTKLAGKWI